MAITWADWFTPLRRVAATCTLIGVVGTSYVAVGLPVPATLYQVDGRIAPIMAKMVNLQAMIISNSLDQLDTRMSLLRNEKLIIEQTLATRIDLPSRQSFNVRLGEIADYMNRIERRREELARQTEDLKK
jgi:hypothetical protein